MNLTTGVDNTNTGSERSQSTEKGGAGHEWYLWYSRQEDTLIRRVFFSCVNAMCARKSAGTWAHVCAHVLLVHVQPWGWCSAVCQSSLLSHCIHRGWWPPSNQSSTCVWSSPPPCVPSRVGITGRLPWPISVWGGSGDVNSGPYAWATEPYPHSRSTL